MNNIKEKDILNFWLDYLEVIWYGRRIENIMFWLNKDTYIKSDLFPWFKVKKTLRVLNYEYKIIFQKDWYDCFAYHKWQLNWEVKTNDFLAVYWLTFKIFENISEIFDFINNNIKFEKIRRFDLALDVPFTVSEIHKTIINKKRRWSSFFDENWELQTFYIWEKRKSKNRYKLFRCYNKIDDIKRNYRQKLYADYLTKENVTRLEIEFRSELCEKIKRMRGRW